MPYGSLPDLMKTLTSRSEALLENHTIQETCSKIADEFHLWELELRNGEPAQIYPAWLPRVITGIYTDKHQTADDKWFEEAKRVCKPLGVEP